MSDVATFVVFSRMAFVMCCHFLLVAMDPNVTMEITEENAGAGFTDATAITSG